MEKIKDDFSSNITCLPNSLNSTKFSNIKRGKSYNYFKTDDKTKNKNYKNKESYISFDILIII